MKKQGEKIRPLDMSGLFFLCCFCKHKTRKREKMVINSIEQSIQDMRMKSRHARFMRPVVISKRGGQYVVRLSHIKKPFVFRTRLLALDFAQGSTVASERYGW